MQVVHACTVNECTDKPDQGWTPCLSGCSRALPLHSISCMLLVSSMSECQDMIITPSILRHSDMGQEIAPLAMSSAILCFLLIVRVGRFGAVLHMAK